MSDLVIAFEMSLIAAGYKKPEPKQLNPIFENTIQELLDYINSKEYRQLIIDEMNNLKTHTS